MKTIKDWIEVVLISSAIIDIGIVVLILFSVGYFWFELVLEPWYQEVFSPWIVEQIIIIFLHPENFCFALGMLVFLGGPIVMVVVITIMNIWGKIKERTYCKRSRCVYLFGMNKDTFFCERCCHRKKK